VSHWSACEKAIFFGTAVIFAAAVLLLTLVLSPRDTLVVASARGNTPAAELMSMRKFDPRRRCATPIRSQTLRPAPAGAAQGEPAAQPIPAAVLLDARPGGGPAGEEGSRRARARCNDAPAHWYGHIVT
jgi:hypothetical protein